MGGQQSLSERMYVEQVQKHDNYFALSKNQKPKSHGAMLNPESSVCSSCKALANLAAAVLLLPKHTDCSIDMV